MSAWKTMDVKPTQPMAVLLYFGNAVYRDYATRETVTFEPYRELAERMELAFWDGSTWCFAGSAHDVYEDREEVEHMPTNWKPLDAPPLPGESNARFIAGPATPSKR